MTDHNREALIAFMRRVNPILHDPLATKVVEEWVDKFVEEFEQAHTPTDDEREALISLSVQWTGDHAYLADAILADGFRRTVQGTKNSAQNSDDEREALRKDLEAVAKKAIGNEDYGPQAWHLVARDAEQWLWESGFRRSEVRGTKNSEQNSEPHGEPSDDERGGCSHDAWEVMGGASRKCADCKAYLEPQAEPSDAAVDAAGPLLYGDWDWTLIREFVFEHVRAALRAASLVG